MAVIEPDTCQIDSKSYQLALDRSGKPVWEVQSGQRLEKEFGFGGAMGEVRCTHEGVCNGFYFAEGFDVTDGTARLHPAITTVGGTRYTGTFDTVGGTTLTDNEATFPTAVYGLKGWTVTITGGTGVGAARIITNNTGTTLTVPSLTTATDSTYDISMLGGVAYSPVNFFDEWDVQNIRALYMVYTDTTITPDIRTVKIRPSDNVVVGATLEGLADQASPPIGRSDTFLDATYVPMGGYTSNPLMSKLATVGSVTTPTTWPTTDTWQDADATVWANACATVVKDGVTKFMRATQNKIYLTTLEPKTLANYETGLAVGDSSELIIWLTEMSDGLIAVHTTTNLFLWDADGNAYPIIPGTRRRSRALRTGYDEFDGHMGGSLSAGVLHPSRTGLWFYQNGVLDNAGIDEIGQGTVNPYRAAANISNIPFGKRHYACAVFGEWIYSIYKPTGFANTTNVHLICGHYQDGGITWRTLLTDSKDMLGLFIDADMKLWWVSNPGDPVTEPTTPTSTLKYITLNADGSPRTTLGGTSTYPRGAASTTYTYYFPEIDFGLPYVQKQLRLMTLETENLPTAGAAGVSIQLGVYRDGGSTTAVGAAITTAGNAVTEREPTVGTTDTGYRFRPYLILTTGASYAPTSSDPRSLRLKLEMRSADMIRTVILPNAQRNLFETKKILRKLKNAGVKTIREPQTNETFSGQIIAVNDTVWEGKQAVELVLSRFSVAA